MAALILTGDPAASKIPSPGNSQVPRCIALVGLSSGRVDPAGTFQVVLRDVTNVPLPNLQVILDFSGCPDVHVGNLQSTPGMTVDAANKRVSAFTDLAGVATFDIAGAVNPADRAVGAQFPCAMVSSTVPLGSATVQAFDQDGAGGVSLSDLALVAEDYFSGTYFARSDYDCSGTLGMPDLSIWAARYFSPGSIESPSSYAW